METVYFKTGCAFVKPNTVIKRRIQNGCKKLIFIGFDNIQFICSMADKIRKFEGLITVQLSVYFNSGSLFVQMDRKKTIVRRKCQHQSVSAIVAHNFY